MIVAEDNGDIIVRTKELCELFSVTKASISKWYKAGCPKIDTGKWNLREVVTWYFDRLESGPGTPEARDLKTRQLIANTNYREEKAKRAKLEREDLEKKYIPKEVVAEAWEARVKEVTNGIGTWSKNLPSMLAGRPEVEIEKILEDEVYDLLDQYYRNGTYIPKEER